MNDDNQSLVQFFETMSAPQLGTLAFNLGGIAWIGLNIALSQQYLPSYVPCAYLTPGPLTVASFPVLLLASGLSIVAIKKGSVIPAIITLTFMWALIASVIREFV